MINKCCTTHKKNADHFESAWMAGIRTLKDRDQRIAELEVEVEKQRKTIVVVCEKNDRLNAQIPF